MKRLCFFFLYPMILLASPLPSLEGEIINENKRLNWKMGEASLATAVVFLSSICPCSNSHLPYLKELKEKWPEIKFIGIHSNTDEDEKITANYFKEAELNFPIIRDNNTTLADRLKALKTPHAYLFSKTGELLYQGGVTNSATASKADKYYLSAALIALKEGKEIPEKRTRVLGCEISR